MITLSVSIVVVNTLHMLQFDPTNRIFASRNLIHVAKTRTPAQARPVSGTFASGAGRLLGLQVSVSVTEIR